MTVTLQNQWAGTFSQTLTFGTTAPELQSTPIALTSGTSVGGGSGTPTAGNWLICIAGWNQKSLPSSTIGVGDDIHSFWRPGNELTSTWAVSTATANVRTAIWYTPNLAAVPGNIYVAPSGVQAGMAYLVIEIAGAGPWDTVTGINTNYAAGATSLNLALGAPSATSFAVAAICGDSSAVTQAFAPGGWTTLSTVTATNGSDHTCDAVLTSAWNASISGSVSVTGTASATDLSGVLIEFQINAASPVPASNNPNWPYLKFEAAFNGGFQTPLDQLTWTDLTPRLWSWDETTGVQYQLGELQATNLTLELDNNDNLLALGNPASYFYGTGWAPQAAFYDELVDDTNPLAWWKLADASGTTTAADSSGNSRTATATSVTFGNTSEAVTGNTSASLASGSTSHLLSSYNPALSAVTVEAWVNLNSLSQSGNPNVLANSHTDSDHKGFELLLTGTTPQVYFGNTSTSGTVKAAAALPASGWAYLAGTWDGATITLYVNGVSQGTAALSGTMPAGNSNIAIGYNPTTASNYVNGLVAEAGIYGTALTASQIAAKYMAGPVGTGVPLRIRAAIENVPPRTGGTGSVTSPPTFHIFESVPVPAGTYTVDWTVTLSGTVGAPETNNFAIGLNSGGGVTTQSVNAGATGTYPQAQVVITATAADAIVIKSWSSTPTTGAVYGGTISFGPNRWYVIQRNAEIWPQKINDDYRRYIEATATDIWSTMSDPGPTPYRGEVIQDNPYAWWACDDQTLDAGVQPTVLRNSAFGNTNVLNITAASGGITPGDNYTTTGVDATTANVGAPTVPASVATYAVNQFSGWMYGDPLASQTSYDTTNPVTASPGSAAWQQTGLLGNTGSNGWFLNVNDASFPVLANGITFSFWFNATFFGSATGFTSDSSVRYDLCGQPYSQITLALLATASNPVASIYLDLSGHLILETWNGASGTTHSIYTSSDLRGAAWHQVTLTTNGSSWNCYVDAGLTASSSGTSAGMTSAWTYLFIGADCAGGGGSSISSATHMGNVAYSHIQVFPAILPPWRINAHYCAAITGFGLLPAPQNLAITTVINQLAGSSYTPDGALYNSGNHTNAAGYGTTGAAVIVYSWSGLAVSVAGSVTSGPSARAVIAGLGGKNPLYMGDAVWLSFTALAPVVDIYTAADASGETEAAQVSGSGDAFSSGYGSGTVSSGVCQTASGTGASPPSSPSTLGDTVQQRIERCMGYGQVTAPMRSIDPSAQLVQAGTDIGGQQTGNNVTNIVQSDGGLLYVDNLGYITYWQRTHLAGQYTSPVWAFGPNTGQLPYYPENFEWLADPQRIFNAIDISPYSPDNSTPALFVPVQAAAVKASQAQFGAQPHQVISYLQSTTEMQNQANWIFAEYGYLHIRVQGARFDAAPDPVLWQLVLGINIGDVVTAQNWNIGGTDIPWTFRVSNIHRHIENNGRTGHTEASVTLQLDWEPGSYFA